MMITLIIPTLFVAFIRSLLDLWSLPLLVEAALTYVASVVALVTVLPLAPSVLVTAGAVCFVGVLVARLTHRIVMLPTLTTVLTRRRLPKTPPF